MTHPMPVPRRPRARCTTPRPVPHTVIVFALLAVIAQAALARDIRPLNVLLIAVDDLRPELGCHGVPHARSPHIDQLAAEGTLFENHFVQVPTCGASRYALLTGRCPTRSGVRSGNEVFYRGLAALSETRLPGAQSLPELFRRSGYHTVCIGKLSHTPDGRVFAYDGSGDGRDEVPHAWDELLTPFGPWGRGWGAFFAYAKGRHRQDGHGKRDLWEFTVEHDDDLPDGLIARQAIDTLDQLSTSDDPFFLGVGFYKPHLPFVAPRADREALADVDVPPPAHAERGPTSHGHESGEFANYDAPYESRLPVDIDDQVEVRRAYLSCVRYVDRQIGRVLTALDDLDLADSTVVVVWGDHGWHLGESAIWGKHTPLERALHSPLIIRAPDISGGRRVSALVATLDVFPTLVDLCAPSFTETQFPLDGKSLRPLLDGTADSIRAAALSTWGNATTVRTAHHRLVFTGTAHAPTSVELNDVRRGPDPLRDITASEPEVTQRLLALAPRER